MAAIRQERSSASGLTGDVDGELPPAQNTAFWVVSAIMPYKPRAEHNGGYMRGWRRLVDHIV